MKLTDASILHKALLAVAVILLPVIITFAVTYAKSSQYIKRFAVDDLTVMAEAFEGQVYQFIEMSRRRARDFSSDRAISDMTSRLVSGDETAAAPLSSYLAENKLPLDKSARRICVISMDGVVLASTDPSHEGADVSGEQYFQRAAAGADVTDRSSGGHPEIAVSSGILDPATGRVLARLVNFIDLAEVGDVLSGSHNRALGAISWSRGKRKSMEAYLVNRDGMMITGSLFVKDAPLNQRVDTLPVGECIGKGAEVSAFYTGYLGTDVAGASMCLPALEWVLIVEVGASEMLAPLYEMKRNAFIGAIVVAGLIGALLAVFYRMVVVRLRLISSASAALAGGGFDISLPESSGDEIGALSRSFNSMARDIKDRERLLGESEQRLRAILDNSLAVIYMKDLEGRYMVVNRRYLELFVLREDEIIGRTDFDIFPEEIAAGLRENDRKVLASGGPVEFEEMVPYMGEARYYLSVKVPIRYAAGAAFAICGISTDITERRLMGDALKASEEKYRSLVSNIPDVIWTAGAKGDRVFVSPNAAEVLGYTAGEIMSAPEIWTGFVHRDDAGRVLGAYGALFTEKRGFAEEYRIRRKDGRWIWVFDRAVGVYEKDGALYADGVLSDITVRKAAEERAVRLNRLYSVLSRISEAIVRVRDIHSLYETACRIAVQDGNFSLAWVGVEDEATGLVKPVACYGHGAACLEELVIPPGKAPGGDGGPLVSNDIGTDANTALFRDKALALGLRSMASVPLLMGGRRVGAINLYSAVPGFFNDEETKLVESLAADISLAIDSIENERLVKKADEELRLLQGLSISIRDAKDFHSALDAVITGLCKATEWALAEAWLPSKDGGELEYAISCGCEDGGRGADRFKGFVEASSKVRFKPGEGIPGRVWSYKRPLWIMDISRPGNGFMRVGPALDAGLRAEFAVPIIEGADVLAVVVFFMAEPREEDKRLINFVTAACAQLGPVLRRKMAEEARSEIQRRYEGLVNNLPIGVYRDLQGSEGRLLEANSAVMDMLDAPSRKALLSRRMRDFYYDPGKHLELYEKMREQGFIKNEDIEMVTFGGRRLWASITAVMKKDDSGQRYYDGIIEDITGRKKLESQLMHAQKMEAVGQLAGGIAHDFNNILTALIGYGNLLIMKRGEDDIVRSYAGQMLSLSEKAANLTQGLLAFSRKQEITTQSVDLKALLKRLEKILQRVIGEDVDIRVFHSDRDITIKADSTQVEHVMMNLATNARDAMPSGGTISIKTELADIGDGFITSRGYGTKGRYALITFSDTGSGMDAETLGRVFEPFFTTKEVGKGTGLGLSMAYGIIKQHNGFIEAKSEAGKGTTFLIYLPLSAASKAAAGEVERVVAGGTETILLAEDQEDVRHITGALLEEYGYTVIYAVDGEEAVRLFIENRDRIDLIMLDMIMPRKSGKEALDEIMRIEPAPRVIFTSGYTADVMKTRGVEQTGAAFVSKPASPGELLTKVREVLDK